MPSGRPLEPPPSRWGFSLDRAEPGEDLLAVGGDLEPGTLLAAYRAGLFPMGIGRDGAPPIGWWSPDPRGVLLPGGMHVSRSLARSARRMEIRVDTCFAEVVAACADPTRSGRWISPRIMAAYTRLHELGWAHSVETWRDGRLVGGLYGVLIGGFFAGESMFHRETDASKVALLGLVDRVYRRGVSGAAHDRLIDVQWRTPHLASLGVVEIPRTEYVERLERAMDAPSLVLD
ncbi:MAG: leucyl/phenylalanyl-tRNA--protein transferase [Dermatophilaceae bacterium]